MPLICENDRQIYFEADGPSNAPVLLLSNSLGTDLSLWAPQVQSLSQSFRVLRYDTRGHGRSSGTDGPYSIEELADDVLVLLDRLEIRKVHFCGISMGGIIGTRLGAVAPERFNKLVLCNTSAFLGPPESWNARIEAVSKYGMGSIVETLLERWFSPGFHQRDPATVEIFRNLILSTQVDGYVACCAAIRDMDQRELLASIQARTLVIAGSHDPVTTPKMSRELANAIREAKYVELNAAHLSNVEDAAAFNAEITAFLSD